MENWDWLRFEFGYRLLTSTVATTFIPVRRGYFAVNLRVHDDAYGNALHYLGEVAGSVLRRQEAEHRARAGAEKFDVAGEGRLPDRRLR